MNSVIFIRHGQSLGNVNHKYYHGPECSNILTATGVDQCLDLRGRIKSIMDPDYYETYTTVIASRFTRAQLTAKIVMCDTKYDILVDARLNETIHKAENEPIELDGDVIARVRSLIEQYEGSNLVLFCHGMMMGTIDPAKGNARNCEARKYDRDDFLRNYVQRKPIWTPT